MALPYRVFKEEEASLQARFNLLPVKAEVRVEQICPVDKYYTDGDAEKSYYKVIINGRQTVYMPQLIYNVSDEYKKILREWHEYVNAKNTTD